MLLVMFFCTRIFKCLGKMVLNVCDIFKFNASKGRVGWESSFYASYLCFGPRPPNLVESHLLLFFVECHKYTLTLSYFLTPFVYSPESGRRDHPIFGKKGLSPMFVNLLMFDVIHLCEDIYRAIRYLHKISF